MKKTIKLYEDFPPIEGMMYKTKMATGEYFTVKKIERNKLKPEKIVRILGIYASSPHLENCPISIDRLILDKYEIGEQEVCHKCGEKI